MVESVLEMSITNSLLRQQQSGGVMVWADIIGDRFVDSVGAPEGVKVITRADCNLPTEVLNT